MATQDRQWSLKASAAQRLSRGAFDVDVYGCGSGVAIARSLADARHNVETLQLYAKSIVRMLEACDAEADALENLSRVSPRARRRSTRLNLQFVRADIDRLVGETQAQLALIQGSLRRPEINHKAEGL